MKAFIHVRACDSLSLQCLLTLHNDSVNEMGKKNLPLAHIEIRSNLLLLRAWLWSWPFLPSGNEEFYVKENAIE